MRNKTKWDKYCPPAIMRGCGGFLGACQGVNTGVLQGPSEVYQGPYGMFRGVEGAYFCVTWVYLDVTEARPLGCHPTRLLQGPSSSHRGQLGCYRDLMVCCRGLWGVTGAQCFYYRGAT